ncbi:MAG: histidine phosphatase family protein [Pseudomonadota bacterium]
MLRLYVMRHAKSSWAVPGARDFDRELNDRGRSDLVKVSVEIGRRDLVPEKVLCSSAVRTRQTLDGILGALKPDPEIEYMDRLYSGGMEDYLSAIRATTGCKSLMTVGHNPMSGSLACSLAGSGDAKAMEKIAYKYPTSTIAVFDFETDDWTEIEPGKGILLRCIIPSKLGTE